MRQKRIRQIEQRIVRIKAALQAIGPMRPGSLTRQYRDPETRTGAYWQISYTRKQPTCEVFLLMVLFRPASPAVSSLFAKLRTPHNR